MSIYERILDIDEATFDRLMSLGVMRSNAKRDLLIYEYYIERTPIVGSMQAITDASEKFNITDEAIKKIVYKAGYFFNQQQNKPLCNFAPIKKPLVKEA